MTDYALSKLFFDLQNRELAAQYRADRHKILANYKLKPEVLEALMANDVPVLSTLVNPYLLRFYFTAAGVPDADFIAKLRTIGAQKAPSATQESETKNG
jgi:hypothetical protein